MRKCIAALFANVPRFGVFTKALQSRIVVLFQDGALSGIAHEVRRTQRDKRGARYTALISAAAARLLHCILSEVPATAE